jgi:hypothetical protein
MGEEVEELRMPRSVVEASKVADIVVVNQTVDPFRYDRIVRA